MVHDNTDKILDENAAKLPGAAEQHASSKKGSIVAIAAFSIWGILCVLLSAIKTNGFLPGCFPFEQIGKWLRMLSLSGTAGNVCAIMIFAILSLIPIAAFIVLQCKAKINKVDWLLLLGEVFLVPTLYFSVNPGLIGPFFHTPVVSLTVISGVFWSVMVAWGVLRLCLTQRCEKRRFQILKGICHAVMALLIYSCLYWETSKVISVLSHIRETNTDPNVSFLATDIVTLTKGVLDSIPTVSVFICFVFAVRLLTSFEIDKYSSLTVLNAARLAQMSRISLCLTMSLCVASNLIQLLFSRYLLNASFYVILPLGLAAMTLVLMVFAEYVSENSSIKHENGMFI